MPGPIPLLDLSSFSSPAALATAVADAVKSVGFLHVKLEGLGLTSAEVKGMFEIHKALYDSPKPDLEACPFDTASRNGYKHIGGDRLSEGSGFPDSKESFVFGHFLPPLTASIQPLPHSIEGRRTELASFHGKCHEAVCTLLDAFSLAMQLPKDFFGEAHDAGTNSVSLINYPAIPEASASDAATQGSRAGAHKDWGSCTLLFQEDDGSIPSLSSQFDLALV